MPAVMHKLFFLNKMTVFLGAEERVSVNSNQDTSTRVGKKKIRLREMYLLPWNKELGKTLIIHSERFSRYGRK